MLVHMIAMKMMHMPVVQVVGMIFVHDSLMSARWAVCMVMSLMDGMWIHRRLRFGHSSSVLGCRLSGDMTIEN